MAQARTILGGTFLQLADYDQGLLTLREALADAVQLQDGPLQAVSLERIGSILRERGEWPQASLEYERAVSLYGSSIQAGYVHVKSADLHWRLGRMLDAERSLADAWQLQKKSQNQKLLGALKAQAARMAYGDGRWDQALTLTREGLSLSGAGQQEVDDLNLIHGLALIRLGNVKPGAESAEIVITKLSESKHTASAAEARLLLAEAWIAVRNPAAALDPALESLKFFEPHQIWESVLRGHVAAARAVPDASAASAHMSSAREALGRMQTLWAPASVESYARRLEFSSDKQK